MQVQHHIGVAGQALQHQALGLQLGVGTLRGERGGQRRADQFGVVPGIIPEQVFDLVADGFTEVDKQAIEVLPALQLIATQRDIHQHLFQAHRIGDGHQHDLAAQAAGRCQLRQLHLEVPRHQHAR